MIVLARSPPFKNGKIHMAPNDIEDAKWFNVYNIPKAPAMPSMAREGIDSVLCSENEQAMRL
jgi:NADH pyrophosphatase NudC (nudix superfamily)